MTVYKSPGRRHPRSREEARASGEDYFETARQCAVDASHSGLRHVQFSTCKDCDDERQQQRLAAETRAARARESLKRANRAKRKKDALSEVRQQRSAYRSLLSQAGIPTRGDDCADVLTGQAEVSAENARALVDALLASPFRRSPASRMGRSKAGQWGALDTQVRAVLIDLTARFGSSGPMADKSLAWRAALVGDAVAFRLATQRWYAAKVVAQDAPKMELPHVVWPSYWTQVIEPLAVDLQ